MTGALLAVLIGLLLATVSGSCVWIFINEVRAHKWRSDFAFGVASVAMLFVGCAVAVCGMMYAVARL